MVVYKKMTVLQGKRLGTFNNKRYVRYSILGLFFLLSFGIFRYFPYLNILKEFWVVINFLYLIVPYVIWKAYGHWRFTLFELYVLTLVAIVPILSGVIAWHEFGQTVIYGVMAQRHIVIAASALMLSYALRNRWVSLTDIEKTLVSLVWIILFLYLLMKLLIDPHQFIGNLGFVSPGITEKSKFKFDSLFIIFGYLYYAFIGLRKKSSKYYLLAGLLFIYLVVGTVGTRTVLFSVVATHLICAYRWSSNARLILLIPKLFISGLLILALLYMANAEYIENLVGKFSDAFTVVLSGEEASDASANARLFETLLVLPYISKHWLLGNGAISNQWHGGYEGVLGGYFYPSDIGILGALFLYGIAGVVLFAMQFVFAWRAMKYPPPIENSALVDAIKGLLLYYLIESISTGRFVHYFEINIVFIAILEYIAFEQRRISNLAILGKQHLNSHLAN